MSEQKIIRLIHKGSGGQKGWVYSIDGIMSTLPASQYKDPALVVIPNIRNGESTNG